VLGSRVLRHATAIAVGGALVACSGGAPATDATPTVAASPAATVPPLHPSVDDYPDTTLVIEVDEPIELPVRVARTQAQKSHGLMEVEHLPEGTGMWFPYDEDRTGGFWMKNTLVPLSIAYIDAEDRIVDIQDMDPCEADPCPSYLPAAPYRSALEVPQGWFDDNGVTTGTTIREHTDS
jgi:uncharacterized protein